VGVDCVFRNQVLAFEDVERDALGPVHRFFDCGLKAAAHVQDDVSVEEFVQLIRGEFDVMWLGPRGREVLHLDAIPADLLGSLR
jgi:hypothetical protein